MGLALTLALTGCKPNKRYDLIEAELRTRDRELAATRQQLDATRNLNRAYEHQHPAGFPGAPPGLPTGAGAAVFVREIAVGRGTGGVDDDGTPGDEALMVVIVPSDEDKSAVKVPGRATIAAWEVTPQGLKQPIGTWELTPEQLRPTWRNGLITTGYFVRLPWQTPPTTGKVRVAVRLTTTDNRAFEADRDVTVRPMLGARPAAVAPGRELLLPGTAPPAAVEELPPPSGAPAARLLPPR
ncbi:hypothetical protein [Urbifossiella limnaea]|uniref:hypothetical protein n=1 Tax=Urbifossiella limnaea TaxID=2528023 RepID=UPI00119ECB1E|nr:hypothetical protein [Urbifossiella limnaea]